MGTHDHACDDQLDAASWCGHLIPDGSVHADVEAGTIELGFAATEDFTNPTSFLRPVRPGRLAGRGRVVRRDGDLVFLEASLADPEGVVVATATATARVIVLRDAAAAA